MQGAGAWQMAKAVRIRSSPFEYTYMFSVPKGIALSMNDLGNFKIYAQGKAEVILGTLFHDSE